MIRRGDIVLLKYPFTNLSATKLRPALVVSSDLLNVDNQDAIFLFITTSEFKGKFDITLSDAEPSFKNTGLKKTSTFRASKMMCLDQAMVHRRLGYADELLMKRIIGAVKRLFEC